MSCVHFRNRNTAKLADVRYLEVCAATLLVLLLKFCAVLNIICGFLMAVCWWRHILQCVMYCYRATISEVAKTT